MGARSAAKTVNCVAMHKLLWQDWHLVPLICQELEGDLLVADELHMGVHIVAAHSQHCMQSIVWESDWISMTSALLQTS